MDKWNDPKPSLRVNKDVADDDDGTGADGRTERGPWAGWPVPTQNEGNAGVVGVGRALRDHYEGVVEEPIPDMLKDILTRLG